MNDVMFARGQMAMSLAFHIVFAAIGVAMPLFMVLAEVQWRRTGQADWLALAKRWAKGTAALFAVGAVSGTALSFELGLLFPGFMEHAGAVIGMPFSLEGFAFFTEAIFLGLYLYGWERLRPWAHVAAGVVVAASGVASALFVTLANAWMNAPRGFRVVDGAFVDVDPVAAMASPAAAHEVVHSVAAAYMATAFAVAGVHALALLRAPAPGGDGPGALAAGALRAFHRKALGLALAVGVPAALLQPIVGHWSGQRVAALQPMKLAAMEWLVETRAWAPLRLGPLKVPGGLSVMAYNRPDAVVHGLAEIPRADWPHPLVHRAFDVMVGIGFALAGLSLWAAWLWWRSRSRAPKADASGAAPVGWADGRRFLWATVLAAPLGFVALEAGWVVTELGRQPWVVYGVLRTADAATPMRGLVVPFVTFTLLYAGLGLAVTAVVWRHVASTLRPAPPAGPRAEHGDHDDHGDHEHHDHDHHDHEHQDEHGPRPSHAEDRGEGRGGEDP
ncbi:MAG TPA: cytochrome ubiquinol oxidase subunit I [Myxococcota bacterium]|jgi:cytochrome d ubiquinol oxidase subunit I|nr:cytochrome ubiquinol oxidase subunit I [Myxococcota bacterium]